MSEDHGKFTEETSSLEKITLNITENKAKNKTNEEPMEESNSNKYQYIIPQKRNPFKSQHIRFFETSDEERVDVDVDVEKKNPLQSFTQKSFHTKNRHNRKSSGKNKKISIPDNWSDVEKMGGCMHSLFVAMRVPLDDKYNNLMKKDQWWTPQMFIDEQTQHALQVGMVIDLTNTLKYYDGIAIFQGTTIEYVKLAIEGFKNPPRDREVHQFIRIVDDFVARRPESRIAVHCTHGLNRTGYMLVQYMVRRMGCTVKEALDVFSVARPPGLLKHMYVEALYTTLGMNEQVEFPVLPKWAEKNYANH
jgi:mRNA-capping enzyme